MFIAIRRILHSNGMLKWQNGAIVSFYAERREKCGVNEIQPISP